MKKDDTTPPAGQDPIIPEVLLPEQTPGASSGVATLVQQTLADNFPQILSLAKDIVEIQKIQRQTDGEVRILEEKRKALLDEARAYVDKRHADTHDAVSRMNCIRDMLQDFYRSNDRSSLTSEDFRLIVCYAIENLGRS